MIERDLSPREVKMMVDAHEQLDRLRFSEIKDGLTRIEKTQLDMHDDIKSTKSEVQFTNGKVRKIIMALIAVVFLSIGMGINNVSIILKLLGI